MAKGYWQKKGLVFTAGFYIILMIYKFIVEQQEFTWKKPFGNLIIALVIGYLWYKSMKGLAAKKYLRERKFIWWKFALTISIGILLVTVFLRLIFWDPLYIQRLSLGLAVAFVAASLCGIVFQFTIFRIHKV